jgi:putative ABC transport system permease protein
MFKNLIKTTLRKLKAQPLFSAINICGLATGLACTILIFLWASDELSYDRHNRNVDSIYRVNWDYNWKGNEGLGSGTPPPLVEAISREIPEVQSATRVYKAATMVVRHEDKFFNEDKIFGVDANLFDFFTVRMIAGDLETALLRPNSVVITESVARKYFGEKAALGQTITMGETKEMFSGKYYNEFEVTGVVENPQHNSHFQFDFLTSMDSHPAVEYFDWSWVWMQVTTYAKLEPGASPEVVESKIPELVKKYAPAAFRRIGFSYEELISGGGRWDFVLQPMTDVYLGSGEIGNRLGPVGSRVYVYLFSVIAVFVLFLACINFMNLATARSSQRAQEIGVLKTLGSTRSALVGQFLMESTDSGRIMWLSSPIKTTGSASRPIHLSKASRIKPVSSTPPFPPVCRLTPGSTITIKSRAKATNSSPWVPI